MHRKTIIVATVLSLCGWLSAQQAVRLNELDINQIKQEYGTVTVRDSLVELYAKSIAKVKLDGKAERFVTQIRVGGEQVREHDPQVMVQPLVDGTKLLFREEAGSKRLVGIVGKDGKIADGSVRFIVKADGKVVHDSGILSPKVGTQTIDIPLKGYACWSSPLTRQPTGPAVTKSPGLHRVSNIKAECRNWWMPMLRVKARCSPKQQSIASGVKINRLPLWEALPSDKTTFDWLLTPEKSEAGIYRSADGKGIVIANGMVSRTFRVMPNLATVGLHQPDVGRKHAACGQRRGNALD